MDPLTVIGGVFFILFSGFFVALNSKPKPKLEPEIVTFDTRPPEPVAPPPPAPAPQYSWTTQKGAYKLTRIMCDDMGLTLTEKNTVCACIYQESRFMNRYPNGKPVTNVNMVNGKPSSTDWGIVQVNDYYHIGPKKTFPSVEYVLDNPEKMVRWMIQCQQKGQLKLWSSYKFGHYKKWLLPNSPMWGLK